MKKILLLNTKYKIFGGEDSNIIDELKALEAKFKVDYLEFDNNQKLNFFDIFSFFFSNNYLSNRRILKRIEEFKPDIIYIHNTWFKIGTGIFYKLKNLDVEIYLKIHNFRYDCTNSFLAKNHISKGEICPKCGFKNTKFKIFNKYYKESYVKSFLVIIYGKSYMNIIKFSEIKLLLLTNFHKNYLESSVNDIKRIQVSHNPILFNRFENKYNPSSNYVVYAGRLNDSKGVSELLQVWSKYNYQFKLLIVGTGEEYDSLNKSFSKNQNIVFTGEKSNEDTKLLIKNARAVITATKMYEGQPRLLCEASSLMVPSIFPKFGGMTEFFPKDYAYSFKQFDYEDLHKKILLLNDKNLLNKTSSEIYKFIKNINNNHIDAFNEAL